ncbi:AmpG family muropeptide MFS transporter [Methylobacter sp. YRD-M1]|uniref:AmpG family muropeptide MFS transporter n=1 Tax=Methylobacter sp. YRD-M1 TaxID=2911520 RepID=UPI00227A6D66|nr:AmpG family muropeptide MFS transporter [Methylobacter sp. YRD-M1]WAK02767.1 AmpG family muropeptide MFS transporter [Methylobacter sp. YRD-M1]
MAAEKSWRSAFSVYAQPRVLSMMFLGFSAGLPFLLVFSTLSAWLRDEGVTRSVIGFFSWVGLTYSIKIFWAPVIDRLRLPFFTRILGKRRGWMFLAQLGIMAGLVGMASSDSHTQLQQIALFAVWVAFCSATQDVVIDAYRIEAVKPEYQGAMAATYVLGYRIALLVSGAGAFYIADYSSWKLAYFVMAAAMIVGIVTTLCLSEPEHKQVKAMEALESKLEMALGVEKRQNVWQRVLAGISDAVLSPFLEFFSRNGAIGLLILTLIAVYKMSDITMGVMANPFYLDLGFSKKEIAEISKVFGFFMTIAGATLGGLLVVRYGIMRPLLLGAIAVASTNLLFAVLAITEPSLWLLAGVISADNLSGGIATSVFIAYLSSLTNTAYTATQYALFSSLMTLPAQLLGGLSGIVVDTYGYYVFFIYASVVGLPAIILVLVLMRYQYLTQARNHSP